MLERSAKQDMQDNLRVHLRHAKERRHAKGVALQLGEQVATHATSHRLEVVDVDDLAVVLGVLDEEGVNRAVDSGKALADAVANLHHLLGVQRLVSGIGLDDCRRPLDGSVNHFGLVEFERVVAVQKSGQLVVLCRTD